MKPITAQLIADREQAGLLLGKKLEDYKNANALVIGIPHGGVCVAARIAEALCLPLDVMVCRKMSHPSNKRDIGSVSTDEVFIHDCFRAIPSDYVSHQLASLRNAIQHDNNIYHGKQNPFPLLYKTVILVDDVLESSDTMISVLRSIRKQKPLKIIVAVPVVNAEAARVISEEADDFLFLRMTGGTKPAREYFRNFPKVDKSVVLDLLRKSKRQFQLCE